MKQIIKGSKEWYEMIETFKRYAKKNIYGRLDLEKNKDSKNVFEDGNVNNSFIHFLAGYSCGVNDANMQ